MAYYSICRKCGGTLDPGEKCDCRKEPMVVTQKRSMMEERKPYAKKIIYQSAYSRKSN